MNFFSDLEPYWWRQHWPLFGSINLLIEEKEMKAQEQWHSSCWMRKSYVAGL